MSFFIHSKVDRGELLGSSRGYIMENRHKVNIYNILSP